MSPFFLLLKVEPEIKTAVEVEKCSKCGEKYLNVTLSLYHAFVASLAKENCWLFKEKINI